MFESFINFLQGNGVKTIVEYSYKQAKQEAVSYYLFDTQQQLEGFLNKFNIPIDLEKYDRRYNKNAIHVDHNLQSRLKTQFDQEKETEAKSKEKTVTSIESEIKTKAAERKQIERSLKKIRKKDNETELKQFEKKVKLQDPTQSIVIPTGDPMRTYAKDMSQEISRIQKGSSLFRNQTEGYWFYNAAHAMDLMFNLYYAKNFARLSDEEREVFEKTRLLLFSREKGKLHGLKADAQLFSYIRYSDHLTDTSNYIKDQTLKLERGKIYREDITLLLDGGVRIKLDEYAPKNLTSILPTATTLPDRAFHQDRFFPDEQGHSETDSIIIQAGGMGRHSSMRKIYKEVDPAVPGGFRYFYTKYDAGGGLETVDWSTHTGKSIYTTEIKPNFRIRNKVINGVSIPCIKKDPETGSPFKLSEDEIKELEKNPVAYRRAMRLTLFALLDAEREIVAYPNPQLTVNHGENNGQGVDRRIEEHKKYHWNFYNNTIVALRGEPVQERIKETPIQESGNCSVFSAYLMLVDHLGEARANDMLQEFKTYQNVENEKSRLKDREQILTLELQTLEREKTRLEEQLNKPSREQQLGIDSQQIISHFKANAVAEVKQDIKNEEKFTCWISFEQKKDAQDFSKQLFKPPYSIRGKLTGNEKGVVSKDKKYAVLLSEEDVESLGKTIHQLSRKEMMRSTLERFFDVLSKKHPYEFDISYNDPSELTAYMHGFETYEDAVNFVQILRQEPYELEEKYVLGEKGNFGILLSEKNIKSIQEGLSRLPNVMPEPSKPEPIPSKSQRAPTPKPLPPMPAPKPQPMPQPTMEIDIDKFTTYFSIQKPNIARIENNKIVINCGKQNINIKKKRNEFTSFPGLCQQLDNNLIAYTVSNTIITIASDEAAKIKEKYVSNDLDTSLLRSALKLSAIEQESTQADRGYKCYMAKGDRKANQKILKKNFEIKIDKNQLIKNRDKETVAIRLTREQVLEIQTKQQQVIGIEAEIESKRSLKK